MTIEYNIIDSKNIHFHFDHSGAISFINILKKLIKEKTIIIYFEENKKYRGKELRGFEFKINDEDEFVSFQNGLLLFEIENEMALEFILFIERAIEEKGFRTPEIITFSPKNIKKNVEITICGFIKMD
ncbi:hypothetical protein FLAVO9AF_140072 [Flavobacterium sp. 9AF]|uniref:hypothetical protein n=1 Tax=Flavobacterium sp. 9AF TaxID=2653142 RepID=UPI0012F2ACAE|nr:hypothetical protein [Flavobacterium sp. 9AF]VXB36521.1 hypothetical protein FLAVO9AF_140072 [Flavobacterium sp. 9AF]